jgi:serpin B
MATDTKEAGPKTGMDLTGQRDFSTRLVLELARRPGNLFVSPFSAWCLLALLYPGARGKTRSALAQVLGLPAGDKDEGWIAELRELVSGLEDRPVPPTIEVIERLAKEGLSEHTKYELIVANALWMQEGYSIEPAYLASIGEHFAAVIETLDLVGDPVASCEAINSWADENTRGKITRVLSPPEIGPLTRLILANATYFKDDWAEKFLPEATRDKPFHRQNGGKVQVPMMCQEEVFQYFEDRKLQAVRLPYAHEGLSMVVVLPKRIRKFEASLTPQCLERLFRALDRTSWVYLELPRCQMRDDLELVSPLEALGLGSLFGEEADFGGISREPGTHVDEVKQVNFVEIDEEGTEAAAVTIAMVAPVASLTTGPGPKVMIVDRPYWFFIRNEQSGIMLFAGRVEDPS